MMAKVILVFLLSGLGALLKFNMIYISVFLIIFFVLFMYVSQVEGVYFDSYFFYDGVSFMLVILSLWISLLMIFSSYKIFRFNEFSNYFYLFVLGLTLVLTVTFFSGNFLWFYFFFEASLIPTLLIIMGWGYQPERVQAGLYFLFYTLTASLPLLMMIMYTNSLSGSLSFFFSEFSSYYFLSMNIGVVMMFMGSLAFLVKLPMYFTHLWLPKAHVEAPVAGSMILAGVLLKLGGYGIIRLFYVTGGHVLKYSSYFMGLSLAGMLFTGILCCRLNDFKALVAYSSVAHMAMVIGGLMTMYCWGFTGAFIMMVAHGLSSSGLFCIVNMYYERTMSRSFFINKGLIMSFPIFSMLLFLLCAANIAAPPTINLLSEIFLMVSIMNFDYLMFLLFPLGSFLGAVFTIFMFSYSQHGSPYFISYSFNFSNIREIHVLVLHIIPVNLIILNSSFMF